MNKQETFDTIIKGLVDASITYVEDNADGRVNSAISEDLVCIAVKEIVEHLDGVTYIEAPARHWFDLALVIEGEGFIPVNVKITQKNGAADNSSSKLGVFYALTGEDPTAAGLGGGSSWPSYCNAVTEYAKPNDRDYYYLVCNKNDASDFEFFGLKELPILCPNANNWPFQIPWQPNMEHVQRNAEEANAFIKAAVRESALRAAKNAMMLAEAMA